MVNFGFQRLSELNPVKSFRQLSNIVQKDFPELTAGDKLSEYAFKKDFVGNLQNNQEARVYANNLRRTTPAGSLEDKAVQILKGSISRGDISGSLKDGLENGLTKLDLLRQLGDIEPNEFGSANLRSSSSAYSVAPQILFDPNTVEYKNGSLSTSFGSKIPAKDIASITPNPFELQSPTRQIAQVAEPPQLPASDT